MANPKDQGGALEAQAQAALDALERLDQLTTKLEGSIAALGQEIARVQASHAQAWLEHREETGATLH